MAKKRKKGRKGKSYRIYYGENRHHLLYWGRYYDKGYAKLLRSKFVYMLDINIHNELHNSVISNIHRPSDKELAELWQKYLNHKELVDHLGIVGACHWLANNCSDAAFKRDMGIQANFLERNIYRKNGGR